jgi:hypothetical protein
LLSSGASKTQTSQLLLLLAPNFSCRLWPLLHFFAHFLSYEREMEKSKPTAEMEVKEEYNGTPGGTLPPTLFLKDECRFGPPLASSPGTPRSAEEFATRIADFAEQWKWLIGTPPRLSLGAIYVFLPIYRVFVLLWCTQSRPMWHST